MPFGHERQRVSPGGRRWPAGHVSAPLDSDLVLVGNASVDLWVRSTATEADLEVTLSEVRADGQETYVQSGWLRASHRKAGPNATPLWPDHSFEQKDSAPLVPGELLVPAKA